MFPPLPPCPGCSLGQAPVCQLPYKSEAYNGAKIWLETAQKIEASVSTKIGLEMALKVPPNFSGKIGLEIFQKMPLGVNKKEPNHAPDSEAEW